MDQAAIKCSELNINKTVYFVTKNYSVRFHLTLLTTLSGTFVFGNGSDWPWCVNGLDLARLFCGSQYPLGCSARQRAMIPQSGNMTTNAVTYS